MTNRMCRATAGSLVDSQHFTICQRSRDLVVFGLQDFSILFASTIVHHMCYGTRNTGVSCSCVSLGTPEPLVFVISHAYMALVMMQLLEQDQWPASSAINSTFVQI